MNNLKVTQIQGVNANDLLTQISEVVTNAINEKQRQKPKIDDELMTRKEVAKFLKVSLQTLHNWANNGVLVPYRIGNKLRYKRSDVLKALIQINKKRVQ